MKVNSLAFRLFATATAWTLIALPIVGVIIYSLISNLILDGFDSRLRQHTWVLQSEAINGGREPSRPKDLPEPLFGVTNSGWYWQIKPYQSGLAKVRPVVRSCPIRWRPAVCRRRMRKARRDPKATCAGWISRALLASHFGLWN